MSTRISVEESETHAAIVIARDYPNGDGTVTLYFDNIVIDK